MGFGLGTFQPVDTALMSQVLPSSESFGKDLGVVTIAAILGAPRLEHKEASAVAPATIRKEQHD
jgi:hypothetical protein